MPIPETPPTITDNGFDVLSITPFHSFTLPKPQLRDSQLVQVTRINRQSRGFTRHSYRDSTWNKFIDYTFAFRRVTTAQKEAWDAFQAGVGAKGFTVTDHNNILNNFYLLSISSWTEDKDGNCDWAVEMVLRQPV